MCSVHGCYVDCDADTSSQRGSDESNAIRWQYVEQLQSVSGWWRHQSADAVSH